MATPVAKYRRKDENEPIRVLFAMGVTHSFYEAGDDAVRALMQALEEAFSNLKERFGVEVLATLDDDETMVGATDRWPWTCYVVADAPSRDAVAAVCNLLRETTVGDDRLWRYLKIEARLGRPLFFAHS